MNKNNQALSIRTISPTNVTTETWKYGQILRGIDEIVIELGDAHWYGGGGLVHQLYPLEKAAIYANPFLTSDNGHTGLLGIAEPFWFNSNGQGVWVKNDDITMSFNAPTSGEPPQHSFFESASNDIRPRRASDIETDGLLRIQGNDLTIYLFECDNARAVVEAYWEQITISPPPPAWLLESPLWTTWAHFKNNINEDNIQEYVARLLEHGFQMSIFGIDAKWQEQFGDTHFDPVRFPNPRGLIEKLNQYGAKVTLWCIPFFMPESEHFQEAIAQGFVLCDQDQQPFIGQWWEGKAAFLDVTNPKAMAWHLSNLKRLADEVGLHGYKFDAGEGMFFANSGTCRFMQDAPNLATKRYIEQAATVFPWSDVRTAWRTQAIPMLYRQWDKSSRWGFDNGLASCITQAITLNLLGYPYSFSDMIGGNQYGDDRADGELMIRWTQAVSPMPFIQFSIAPWDYGTEVAKICARYAQLHQHIAPYTLKVIQQNAPIIRPIWWLDPTDTIAQAIDDEYLVGDELLVAPIIEKGAVARNIYLPKGKWRNYWNESEIYQGKCWLEAYPAPLDVLPLFIRLHD